MSGTLSRVRPQSSFQAMEPIVRISWGPAVHRKYYVSHNIVVICMNVSTRGQKLTVMCSNGLGEPVAWSDAEPQLLHPGI